MSQKSSTELTKFHPVTHVIFDCDGLLINSEFYYSEALTEVATRHGKKFNYDIKLEMMGKFRNFLSIPHGLAIID